MTMKRAPVTLEINIGDASTGRVLRSTYAARG
jgi:hypothetical protein